MRSAPELATAVRSTSERSRSPLVLESEQVPHSISIKHSVGGGSSLFHPDGRQMQELVEDLRRDRIDGLPLLIGQPPGRLAELRSANRLGAGPQRRDRRDDVERRLPGTESLRLLRDQSLCTFCFAPPAGQARCDDRLEVVDVVQVATVEVVDGGIEIAWNREVDQE